MKQIYNYNPRIAIILDDGQVFATALPKQHPLFIGLLEFG